MTRGFYGHQPEIVDLRGVGRKTIQVRVSTFGLVIPLCSSVAMSSNGTDVPSPANTRAEQAEKLKDYGSLGVTIGVAAIWPK